MKPIRFPPGYSAWRLLAWSMEIIHRLLIVLIRNLGRGIQFNSNYALPPAANASHSAQLQDYEGQ